MQALRRGRLLFDHSDLHEQQVRSVLPVTKIPDNVFHPVSPIGLFLGISLEHRRDPPGVQISVYPTLHPPSVPRRARFCYSSSVNGSPGIYVEILIRDELGNFWRLTRDPALPQRW